MIKVRVFKKSSSIGYNIKGHADYDEHGRDILCAAVSILSHTIYRSLCVNLDLEKDLDVKTQDGFMNVCVNKRNSEIELLVDTLIEGIKSLEEDYGDFIKLTLEEE